MAKEILRKPERSVLSKMTVGIGVGTVASLAATGGFAAAVESVSKHQEDGYVLEYVPPKPPEVEIINELIADTVDSVVLSKVQNGIDERGDVVLEKNRGVILDDGTLIYIDEDHDHTAIIIDANSIYAKLCYDKDVGLYGNTLPEISEYMQGNKANSVYLASFKVNSENIRTVPETQIVLEEKARHMVLYESYSVADGHGITSQSLDVDEINTGIQWFINKFNKKDDVDNIAKPA